ncbi:MAG: flagellar basal body L-ring protein FlgH [Terriglobales bacterium]
MKVAFYCLLLVVSMADYLHAKKRDAEQDGLAKYLARLQLAQAPAPVLTLGSIWVDSGRMASLSADYKAMVVGDTIEIVVSQGLTSSNANAVNTSRTLTTSGGIDSVPVLGTGGAQSLLGLHSSEALAGKGAATTATSVTTNLAGRVVAVLAGGNMVVEARRVINMNNEKQTIILRGVVRRGDIGPSNTVASDAVGDLELEIKGKGVISDSVRQPHKVLRFLMRLFDF